MRNIKNQKCTFFLVLIFVFGISCSRVDSGKVQFSGQIQGTYYVITYYDNDKRNFQPEIIEFLKNFDRIASLWEKESIISKVNNNEDMVVDSVFADIFTKAMEVSIATDGNFDITVGPLTAAWGFGVVDRQKLNKKEIDSLLQFVDYKKIILRDGKILKQDPNIYIDFNAIAKGYSVDMIGKLLESKGIDNYLVDIGGEVLAKGNKPNNIAWIVGVEEPAEDQYSERKIESKIQLKDMAIATSGSYRKYYEENGVRYSHTVDPKTGYPVAHSLLSVSVLAKECWKADAYATAFMVMGLEKSLKFLDMQNELEAYFIYYENDQMKTFATEGFKENIIK